MEIGEYYMATALPTIEVIEKRQGLKIACLEEIALRNGWITSEQLKQQTDGMKGCYFENLHKIL